jgi:hypothetical protein
MALFIKFIVIKDSEGGTMYIPQGQLENLKKVVQPGRWKPLQKNLSTKVFSEGPKKSKTSPISKSYKVP